MSRPAHDWSALEASIYRSLYVTKIWYRRGMSLPSFHWSSVCVEHAGVIPMQQRIGINLAYKVLELTLITNSSLLNVLSSVVFYATKFPEASVEVGHSSSFRTVIAV